MFFLLGKVLLLGCALVMSGAGFASEDNQALPNGILYRTDSVKISTEDFYDYLLARDLSERQVEVGLAAPGAIRNLLDSMFLIEVLSNRAEENPAIDIDRIEAITADRRARLLMNAQLELEIEALMSKVDLLGLARDEYNANRSNYVKPGRLRASHILISTSDHDEEEALALTDALFERLESGESFESLAQEFSEDSVSGAAGGDLGFFSKGKMVPSFEAAAYGLSEVGDFTAPVKTKFGFHLIKLTDREAEEQLTFEQSKSRILPIIEKQVRTTARQTVLDRAKAEATAGGVEVDIELLQQLEVRFGVDLSAPADN